MESTLRLGSRKAERLNEAKKVEGWAQLGQKRPFCAVSLQGHASTHKLSPQGARGQVGYVCLSYLSNPLV